MSSSSSRLAGRSGTCIRSWIIFFAISAFSFAVQADQPDPPHQNIFDFPKPTKPTTAPSTQFATVPLPATTEVAPASQPASESAVIVPQRVPSERELAAAARRVDDLFGKDITAAKTADKKLDLAELILNTAADEKTDRSAQFQALVTARDLAVKGQDFRLACRAIQQLGKRFYIDVLANQAAVAGEMRETPLPESDRRLFCLQVESIARAMASAGRFDLIAGIDQIAKSVAASTSDAGLSNQIRRYTEEHNSARSAYIALAGAREILKSDPTNGPANTALGRYACFEQDDWTHGLPLLAAGSDVQLRQAAQADVISASADQKDLLANVWWEIAQDQPEPAKQRILDRAYPLYVDALPELNGLEKAVAAKRIASIKSTMVGDSTAVDLLDLVDPFRDTVTGKWEQSDSTGVLTSAPHTDSRITFLYHPPREYDFRVVFTRAEGNNAIELFCLGGASDRQFRYMLGGYENTIAAFSLVQAMNGNSNHNTTAARGHAIEKTKRYTLTVKVRAGSVQPFIDDKPISTEYRTDFRDLAHYRGIELNRPDVVGLIDWDSSFIIHSAYVVECNGHGHSVAMNDPKESPVVATANYTGPGNGHRPFAATLYANGTVDSSFGPHAEWFVRGNELVFRWGDNIDICRLSNDRKSFTGKSPNGENVSGQFIDGGI